MGLADGTDRGLAAVFAEGIQHLNAAKWIVAGAMRQPKPEYVCRALVILLKAVDEALRDRRRQDAKGEPNPCLRCLFGWLWRNDRLDDMRNLVTKQSGQGVVGRQ